MAKSKYTEEENRWICEHINDGTYSELAVLFLARFNRTVATSGLRKQACRLGLNGKKFNSSHLVKGECRRDVYPIGAERTDAEGIVYIKVADNRSVYNKRLTGGYASGGNWRKKAYHNWEQAYGSIPEGKRLVYLDSNKQNCDVSNLYFTDARIQMRLGRNGWQSTNPELTLAAIKLLELTYAIKEVGTGRGEDNQ